VGREICRWVLATLGLLGGLTAQAASPVWAIHGAHNTVYLAGSVHLLKAEDAALPPGFNRAYGSSQGLVMELDLDNLNPLEATGWIMEHGTLPEGTTLRQRLGESRYQRVASEAERLGMPAELLQQFQPWVIGMQLLELQYQQLGFQPEEGVEQQLEQRAQADRKPVSGLETVAEQLGVLGGMSDADQMRFLDMIVAEMGDVDSDTQAVIVAWRNGDAARLAKLLSDEYKSFPALYRVLVSDRNQRWLPQIEKLLQERQDYFVIVGALHLVGDGGLLDLVHREGYRTEQLN
jgi:uncharacterized protein YbaP (TraB family)